MSSDLLNAPKEFLRLFKAGKEAAKSGQKQQAHDLFRQAIEVDPYHEQVWLWLASVVSTDEDRRVCFENVLELNPDNALAARQLQRLEEKALTETMAASGSTRKKKPASSSRWLMLFILLAIVASIVLALALTVNLI